MDSEQLNDALKAISNIWNQLTATIEGSMKVLSEFFDSLRNEEIRHTKKHSPYKKKKNCYFKYSPNKFYRVERRVQRHLPYQRRNY